MSPHAEITAAVYRETQERILTMLAIDAEASRLALEEIDELLAKNEAERQAMIADAVKLEDGTAIFLAGDETAIYTEHGDRISEDDFHTLLDAFGDKLRANWRWDAMVDNRENRELFLAEHAEVEQNLVRATELQADVDRNALTLEEMEAMEADYAATTPDRVRGLRPTAEAALARRESAPFANQSGQPIVPPAVMEPSDPALPETSLGQTAAASLWQRPVVPVPGR